MLLFAYGTNGDVLGAECPARGVIDRISLRRSIHHCHGERLRC
jgi:hypothetical protein